MSETPPFPKINYLETLTLEDEVNRVKLLHYMAQNYGAWLAGESVLLDVEAESLMRRRLDRLAQLDRLPHSYVRQAIVAAWIEFYMDRKESDQ